MYASTSFGLDSGDMRLTMIALLLSILYNIYLGCVVGKIIEITRKKTRRRLTFVFSE
jgi:hypothetical protein